MKLSVMFRIRQTFARPVVNDLEEAIRSELNKIFITRKVLPGQKVAITAGSRGIKNIALITKILVDEFKSKKAIPFIVPAMGSHGGATARGQVEVLEKLGITSEYLDCPIESSMEVEEVARSGDGVISYVDKRALSADHIVVGKRVKSHTEFEGVVESGLCKMLCIGLGKHIGTIHYHRVGVNVGLEQAIVTGARGVLKNTRVLCGVGIVENAYGETGLIRAFLPEDIEKGDAELLALYKKWAAKLPLNKVDILIVDEIGKDISGSGLDTKVVGRVRSVYSREPRWPKIKRVIALDLTEASKGNAIGLGLADFVSRRLVDKIDRNYTYVNGITAQTPNKAAIPVYYESDRELIEQALATIGLVDPEDAKIIRIKNTSCLFELDVSQACLKDLKRRKNSKNIEVIRPSKFSFDQKGILDKFD